MNNNQPKYNCNFFLKAGGASIKTNETINAPSQEMAKKIIQTRYGKDNVQWQSTVKR